MEILFITAMIISILAAVTIGVLIALLIQSRILRNTGFEHEAWQLAQEAHQNVWEIKQRKQTLEMEQQLTRQIQHIQEAWQAWQAWDTQRLAQLTLEQKLALIPHIEDVPVSSKEYPKQEQNSFYDQQSPLTSFFRTNLNGRDLSQRSLKQADFREAQLENANFYMADLAGATFTGANLAGANLAGANLTGADVRDAILTNVNLLVTDLNGAILIGANLLGAHNLTSEQINSAIYNHSTQTDVEFDLTHPRIARIHFSNLKSSSKHSPIEIDSAISIVKSNGKTHSKSN